MIQTLVFAAKEFNSKSYGRCISTYTRKGHAHERKEKGKFKPCLSCGFPLETFDLEVGGYFPVPLIRLQQLEIEKPLGRAVLYQEIRHWTH